MLKYCDKCEQYVEPENGRCPDCQSKLSIIKEKKEEDEWGKTDLENEWGLNEDDLNELS